MRVALSIVVGAALGALSALTWAEASNQRTFDALEEQLAEQRARVGAACEPVYAVAWVDYDCPIFGSKMPAAVKPVACTAVIRAYRAPTVEAVRKKIQERVAPGAPTLFLEERGVKERETPVSWDARIGK